MIKRTLTVLVAAVAIGTAGAGTATAAPVNRADADLQQEVASQGESCGPRYYPKDTYLPGCAPIKRLDVTVDQDRRWTEAAWGLINGLRGVGDWVAGR